MRRPRCRRGGGERGASAVELALLTPMIGALLVGSTELALMFNRTQDLEGAAREGARYASDDDNRTKAEIATRAMSSLENAAGVTVTVDPDVDKPCDGHSGDPVSVNVSVPEDLDLLFITTVSVNLGGTASFICSNNQAPAPTPTP
jgi:Flp pilus assembly protein TadG